MDKELNNIITEMKLTYGIDLSIFDEEFIMKSLHRRCDAIGLINLTEYHQFMEENKTEAANFYNSLHITFSQFFRNTYGFAALEQTVFHNIIAQKPQGSEIRIWSAGCSSGQEAYSLGMQLCDLSETSGKEIRFRIFATDISRKALAEAEAGIYDYQAVQNVTLRHLNRYFIKHENTFAIVPQLKGSISFSYFDLFDPLTANPVESIYGDFDLIICSNVLIYYKPYFQQILLKKLLGAMSTNGYLVTDESEGTLIKNSIRMQQIELLTSVFKNKRSTI